MREDGAISATSRVVADRVAAPIVRRSGPLAVLEVGAGTGAVTDAILTRLGAGDRLDVYEINATFAALLRVRYAEHPVRVVEADVDTLPPDARYDAIVSSLPLMNFPPDKVRRGIRQALQSPSRARSWPRNPRPWTICAAGSMRSTMRCTIS